MMRNAIFLSLVVLAMTFTPASAALYDLSEHGYAAGLIYDSDANLVWLQDANYARTSGHDTDGVMTWNEAVAWAGGLDVFGYRDWRLPQYASLDFNEPNSEFSTLDAQFTDPDNRALFVNAMPNANYWSETLLFGRMARVYNFSTGPAALNINSPIGVGYAWAVHDGSGITLTHTPVPASLWLLASGVFCLLGYRRKRSG